MNNSGTPNSPNELHVLQATNVHDYMLGLATILRQSLTSGNTIHGKWNDGDAAFRGGLKASTNTIQTLAYMETIEQLHELLIIDEQYPVDVVRNISYKTSIDDVHTLLHIIMLGALTFQGDGTVRCIVPFVSDFPMADAFDDLCAINASIVASH